MAPILKGIDTSHWHPVRSFTELKAGGYVFDWHKASEGTSSVDDTLDDHRHRASRAGVVFGAYHFLRREPTAAAQVEQFLGAVRTLDGIMLGLDVERRRFKDGTWSDPTHDQTLEFVGRLADLTGMWPVVYTNISWWKTAYGELPYPAGCPLWIARWGTSLPPLPTSWPRPHFWQWTDRETVPGVDSPVDGDSFFGTIEELKALAP